MTPLAQSALLATAALATGADLTLTLVGLRLGFREENPLMRAAGRFGMCAFGWATVVGSVYAALTSHPVAWLAAAFAIALRGYVALGNWRLLMARLG